MQRFCEQHSKPGNPSHTVLSPGKSSQEETLCSAIKLCSVPPPWSSPLKTLWESDWGLKGEIPGGNAVPWMGHSTHTPQKDGAGQRPHSSAKILAEEGTWWLLAVERLRR